MKKTIQSLLLVTLGLLLSTTTVLAQSGKMQGVVKEKQTGETIPGATILLEGTTRGAVTDLDGKYLILNVPPGTYNVIVRGLGYSTLTVEDVVIRTDLTTEQNFELQMESFEGETVTVQAKKVLIIKDMTSSEARVSKEEIEKLPVQELQDIVQLQAGVNVGNGGAIHIRGGRASEVSYVVDGIRVTDDYNRGQGLRIENQSVQELQVVSGTFNAEHGQAMSGIINIVSRAGSNNWEGRFSVWSGNYLTSNSEVFKGVPTNPTEWNPSGQYNFAASIGGPIIKDKVTFFASARRFHNQGWLFGRNAFSATGPFSDTLALGTSLDDYRTLYNQRVDLSRPWWSADTTMIGGVQRVIIRDDGTRDSSLVAMNPFDTYNFQGNVQWNINSTLRMNLIGSISMEEGRGYGHNKRLAPSTLPTFYNNNNFINLKTTYTPSSRTFMTFNVAQRFNGSESFLYRDPYDPRYFNYENLTRYGADVPGGDRFDRLGTINNHFNRSTQSFVVKGEISSQLNDNHFIKAGLEFQSDIISLQSFNLQPLRDSDGIFLPDNIPAERRPFIELGIPPVNTPNHTKFTNKPVTFAGFIQDKIEYQNLIINVGVRFDYFDPNARVAADPQDPDIFSPTKPENIALTPEQREAIWWKDVSAKYQLSPRLGIAYPINERGVLYFSYGYFFQMPSYEFLYNNSQILLGEQSGVFGIFGNPDLRPERSIQYELGLKQEIFTGTAIEVTGFYKDSRDYVSSGRFQRTYNPTVRYDTWINRDYASSVGLTLALAQRLGTKFNFAIDYTFTRVEGSNSNPAAEFNLAVARGDDSGSALTKFIRPLDWDRSHILNTTLFYNDKTWGANIVSRLNTGTPYTPTTPFLIRNGPAASQRDLFNTARLPNRWTVDLNAYKTFRYRNTDIRVFANIFNALDIRIVNGVFADSGDPLNPLFRTINADPTFYTDPSRFAEPRRIQIGIEFSL